MIVYICLIFCIILFNYIIKDKKKYCIFCGIILFLPLILRDPTLGNSDTVSLYIPAFERAGFFDFLQMFEFYKNSDVTFYMITKLFVMISNDLNLYLGLCAFPLCYFVSRCIYKYSKYHMLSFVIFFSLNFYAWSFIILRHAIALGFVIWSYDYIRKKQFVKFLLILTIAALFHKSALTFFLAYPIANQKHANKKIIPIILLFIIPVILIFGTDIMKIIFTFINTGDYLIYQARESKMGIMMFFVYYIFLIFASFFIKKDSEKENFNIYLFGVLIIAFSIMLAEFFRIGMFYMIFMVLLVPNIICEIKNRETKQFINLLIILICLGYSYVSFNSIGLIPYISNLF